MLSVGLGRQDSGHAEDLRNLLRYANEALSSHKFFSGVHLFCLLINVIYGLYHQKCLTLIFHMVI